MTTIIPNTIIRASAGSGKTYKLSSRYIALLLDGKPAEEILASTFTVKAAGEILQRVLQRLSAAVLDKDKYTELCKSLRDDFGERIPVPNKEKLQSVTAELARNLHRVQVGTLDSFFHKIARSFGLELNLPPDWTMVEDDAYARLLQEAIRNVLKKDTGNASGKINGLLHQWHEEKSTLTITRELVELATKRLSLIREVQKNPAVWDNEILFTKESTDDEIERAVQTLERAEVPQTKTGTPNKNFVKTINKVCTLVRKEGNECWKEFLESSTLIQAVADRTGKYYDKDIPDELDSAVSRLIEQARAALLNKLVRKTRAARELLTLIAQEYDALLYPSGAFRYEDITEKVCRASVDDMISVQMMAHRLDSDLGYLLLDEFQDTSLPQWKIIKPFAIEAKKSGSVFVVGDVKQAIYAWRGGVAEIFDKVEEELEPFDTQELAKSYRSAQPVIDTVNTVFEKIEDNLLFEDETKDDEENNYIAAAKLWKGKGKKGFETHTTAKDFSGYCSLVLIPTADVPTEDEYEENYSDDENGEDSRKADKFIEDTAEKIKELHYAKPYAKIGVLVRRNRFITQFISALKAKNVEAKEEGGNPLPNDSAAVRVVLSALMLADHPGDTVARFHVADSPLAEHCGLTEYRKCIAERKLNDKNYLENDGKFAARNWSEKTRCKAATEGLGSVVKELAEVIRQKENLDADFPRESQWLEKLIELAFQFETEAKEDRLSRFVERVKVKGVSGKSDEGDITVTNIHKSKGLEYDIVVLPDLTCEFYYNTTDMIVSRKSPVEPVDFVVRYAFKALQRFLPKEYREAFDRRIRGEIVESLNLLYVAMTRAKRELMMLVPHKTADKNGNPAEDEHKRKTFGNLLLKGLSPEIEEYGNGGVFYAHGNADWYQEFEEELKKKQKYAKKEEPEQPIPAVFKLKTEPKKRSFLRLVPSGADKKAEPPTSETVKTEDTEEIQEVVHGSNNAMRRGTAIHKCFEFTLNRDPFLEHSIPGKGELLQNCQEDETKELDWDEIIESFTKMCGNANVRKALSRSAYPADETVVTEHERRFIVKVKDDDEDKIVNGTIDRLIIRRRGGKVVGVDIIDFKTGGRNDEFYEPQMQLYRQSAVELYRIDESDVTVKLLYVSLGEAVPV